MNGDPNEEQTTFRRFMMIKNDDGQSNIFPFHSLSKISNHTTMTSVHVDCFAVFNKSSLIIIRQNGTHIKQTDCFYFKSLDKSKSRRKSVCISSTYK